MSDREQQAIRHTFCFIRSPSTRVCLAKQVGREEAAEKPFLEERQCTSEANEKMVLEPLAYSSDTL
ncbi:hypothetical protein C1X05_01770 [Laceyella sacchari]|uniref:hypothetical protein n=1 Tax=Laceyella tengchongensis TaxID=574699 RepID=UPI000C9F13B2|nr:hypothetical protein [Laceyella tengchongensis]AUS07692.1 hypothetical protein C1X05_01770 [Laceyella sacchari]